MKNWRPYLHVILFKHISINQSRGSEGQSSQNKQKRREGLVEKHTELSFKLKKKMYVE